MPLNVAEFIQDFIHADYFMQNEKMESFISIELQPLQKSEFVNIMNELLKSTSNTSPEYPSVLFLAGWSHIYLHEKCDSKQAIAHFTEAGEFNHPLSWLFLASFLWLGYSVKSEQYRKAVTLTEKAISAKCTLAMVVKAEAYVTGAHSTPVCRKTASDLYDLAITYNSTAAMCGRGIMYEQDGDLAAATALFDRAVMLGSSVGQYERGRLYEKAGDKLMAEQYYDQAIAKGNSKAMLAKTNLLLEKGDKVAAIELLDRAYQNKNNTEAKFKRAQLFEEAGDFETATSFYEDCAKKLPAAKVALAKILWNGNGFPQDRQKALSLCKEALDKGFTEMPPLIRGLIEEEKGNYALACEFYNQGVLANDPEAMVLRAKLHLSNRGGPRNQKSAEELLDKAITLNSTEAMYMRANQFLIDKKKVSSADKEKATKLYDQAIALGHFSSLHKRAELYKETDTTMNHMRARVLFTLADAFPKRALLHEDSGVYTLMVSGNDESISLDSFYALGRTLQFLKTLPQNFAKVALIKKNIFDAVNTHIITKYPLDDNFYAKISKLSSGVIDGIVFLLKEYALEKYNEEGYRELQRVISNEGMAHSKDPHALLILEKLAAAYPAHGNYWLGEAYFVNNAPEKFYLKSGLQRAIELFQKAANNPNTPEDLKKLANERLTQLQGKQSPEIAKAPTTIVASSTAMTIKTFEKAKADHSQYVSFDSDPIKEPAKKAEPSAAVAIVQSAPPPVSRPAPTPAVVPITNYPDLLFFCPEAPTTNPASTSQAVAEFA